MDTIHFTQAGAGEHFLLGTDLITVKAASRETSGQMLVLEVTVPPGGGPPMLHRHAYAETFYFLEGQFTISAAGADLRLRTVHAQAGDTLAIPSMVWHNFRNESDTPGRFLVVHSPVLLEAFLRESGQPVEDLLHFPKPSGPPAPALLEQIGRYMEFLPPDQLITG